MVRVSLPSATEPRRQGRDRGAGRGLRNVEEAAFIPLNEVTIEPEPESASVAPQAIVVAPV